MEFIPSEKVISHPLESVLDIEPGTTVVQYEEPVFEPPVQYDGYDDKDKQIDGRFNEVYNLAIAQASALTDEVERVEGKYKRGLAENAAQMLSIALQAAAQEGNYKIQRAKVQTVLNKEQSNNITNNVIVTDRNQLMKMLREGQTIDG